MLNEKLLRRYIEKYKSMSYEKLKKLADISYRETFQEGESIQVSVSIFYEDSDKSIIRGILSLYDDNSQKKWWNKFIVTPDLNEDFLVNDKGHFLE